MSERLRQVFWTGRTKYVTSTVVELLVIFIIGAIWWNRSSSNPQSVFWEAISNNFTTSAMTIASSQTAQGETQGQKIQIDLGQRPIILTLTTLVANKALVKTEDINTPNAEFTRYLVIKSPRKTKSGKSINYHGVIGIWSKTETAPTTSSPLPSNLGSIMLGLSLPFGNLTNSQRDQLVNQAQSNQVYNTDFQDVKRATVNGRSVFVYKVTIQPVLYIRFMKSYAAAMGLHQLDQVNPNSYGGQQPLAVTWTIDAHSKQLIEADFGANHVEKFAAYGVPVSADLPKNTVTATSLQAQLSKLLAQ